LKPAFVIPGALLYGAGTYYAYELVRPKSDWEQPSWRPTEQFRKDVFEDCAAEFDSKVHPTEVKDKIIDWRIELLKNARGRVLEVAAGTGRNIEYYPAGCEVRMIDWSPKMCSVANHKIASRSGFHAAEPMDAANLRFDTGSFDTVVDTFGICSVEQPEIFLREMGRVCAHDGVILLLEHGRSDWSLINWWLDSRAHSHVHEWGCFWNRDIVSVLERSGLEVLSCERKHLGTLYKITCCPSGKKNP